MRIMRIVAGLTTGEKVSPKSFPCTWWNPLATSLALYLFKVPSGFCFTRKTHLQPMACLCGGSDVKDQVPFFTNASYSVVIASCHFGLARACLTVCGSATVRRILGFSFPVCNLVTIWCVLVVGLLAGVCGVVRAGAELVTGAGGGSDGMVVGMSCTGMVLLGVWVVTGEDVE